MAKRLLKPGRWPDRLSKPLFLSCGRVVLHMTNDDAMANLSVFEAKSAASMASQRYNNQWNETKCNKPNVPKPPGIGLGNKPRRQASEAYL